MSRYQGNCKLTRDVSCRMATRGRVATFSLPGDSLLIPGMELMSVTKSTTAVNRPTFLLWGFVSAMEAVQFNSRLFGCVLLLLVPADAASARLCFALLLHKLTCPLCRISWPGSRFCTTTVTVGVRSQQHFHGCCGKSVHQCAWINNAWCVNSQITPTIITHVCK